MMRMDWDTGAVSSPFSDPAVIAKFDIPLSGSLAHDGTMFVTNGDLQFLPTGPGAGLIQVGVDVRRSLSSSSVKRGGGLRPAA